MTPDGQTFLIMNECARLSKSLWDHSVIDLCGALEAVNILQSLLTFFFLSACVIYTETLIKVSQHINIILSLTLKDQCPPEMQTVSSW